MDHQRRRNTGLSIERVRGVTRAGGERTPPLVDVYSARELRDVAAFVAGRFRPAAD